MSYRLIEKHCDGSFVAYLDVIDLDLRELLVWFLEHDRMPVRSWKGAHQ